MVHSKTSWDLRPVLAPRSPLKIRCWEHQYLKEETISRRRAADQLQKIAGLLGNILEGAVGRLMDAGVTDCGEGSWEKSVKMIKLLFQWRRAGR